MGMEAHSPGEEHLCQSQAGGQMGSEWEVEQERSGRKGRAFQEVLCKVCQALHPCPHPHPPHSRSVGGTEAGGTGLVLNPHSRSKSLSVPRFLEDLLRA